MTQDEMDEIDRRVAEEVMGWHRGPAYGSLDGWLDANNDVIVTRMYFLPSRFFDLAAHLVMDKLKISLTPQCEGWVARVDGWPLPDGTLVKGPHMARAPLAICMAALAWKEAWANHTVPVA